MIAIGELALYQHRPEYKPKTLEIIAEKKYIPFLRNKYELRRQLFSINGASIDNSIEVYTNNTYTANDDNELLIIYKAEEEEEYESILRYNFNSSKNLVKPLDLSSIYHILTERLTKQYNNVSLFLRDLKVLSFINNNFGDVIDKDWNFATKIKNDHYKVIKQCPYVTNANLIFKNESLVKYDNIFSLEKTSNWSSVLWNKDHIYNAVNVNIWKGLSKEKKYFTTMELLYLIMTKEIISKVGDPTKIDDEDLFYFFKKSIMYASGCWQISISIKEYIIDNIDSILEGFSSIFYISRYTVFNNKNKSRLIVHNLD